MELIAFGTLVYAVWAAVKHTPEAAKKDLTLKSAEATQRVILWGIAAVILFSFLNSMGGS